MTLDDCPVCNNEKGNEVMNGIWNEGYYIKCPKCQTVNFESTEHWLRRKYGG